MLLRFGKTIMFLLFATLLVALSACGSNNDNDSDNNEANDDNAQEEANAKPENLPEPDLDDIPDVVAEVNGEEIPKEEFEMAYEGQFQQALMQAQMSGEEIDQDQMKSQLADGMIGQELLIQEFDNNESDLSEDVIDNTLQDAVEQNGMESEDELFDALEEQGTSKDTFMENVKAQAKIDQLVNKEAGDVEPSEDEIKETYEGLKKQQESLDSNKNEDNENADEAQQPEIPDYEEAKPRLKEQLTQQKKQEARQELVRKLRDDADVTNHLS